MTGRPKFGALLWLVKPQALSGSIRASQAHEGQPGVNPAQSDEGHRSGPAPTCLALYLSSTTSEWPIPARTNMSTNIQPVDIIPSID